MGRSKSLKSLIVTGLLSAGSMIMVGCPTDPPTPLSPARKIVGLWTTPYPVTIYLTSDGCGSYGRDISTPYKMTWNITYVDDNHVDISITANYIGATTQLTNCGLPVPLAFPLSLHGFVSSSNLQLIENQGLDLTPVVVGNFNFTTNNLTGTITEKDCLAYCAGYETDANKCILTK